MKTQKAMFALRINICSEYFSSTIQICFSQTKHSIDIDIPLKFKAFIQFLFIYAISKQQTFARTIFSTPARTLCGTDLRGIWIIYPIEQISQFWVWCVQVNQCAPNEFLAQTFKH